jgi:N-acetylneuraminic acid mutarotase
MKLIWLLAAASVIVPLVGAADIKLTWRTGKDLPVPVAAPGVMTRRGLVLIGGTTWRNDVKLWLKEARLYDPARDAWTDLPSLPEPLGVAAAAAVNDTVYVIGGSDGESTSSRVYRLRPGATAWEPAPALPEPRVYASAEAVGTRIYVFGGSNDVKSTRGTTTVWALDTSAAGRGWQKLAPIPAHERTLSGVVAAGGKIYLFGGYSEIAQGKNGNLADSWSYDPAHDKWSRIADLPAANRYMGTAAWDDNTIFVLGGAVTQPGGQPDRITESVWLYSPRDNRYVEVGKQPGVNAGMVFGRSGNRLVGAGGEPGAKMRSPAVWIATF